MKKAITLFIILSLALVGQAQVTKTVNVTTAGTLSTEASAYLSTVTNLTITGTIDARDFKTMRDNMPALAILDLSSITITAYTGDAGTMGTVITTYPTNEIPKNSFYNTSTGTGKTSITNINLPLNIISLGENCFYGCNGLTNIIIPNSVTQIGKSSFTSCYGLKNITIGSGVTSIGDYAFYGCSNLNYIYSKPTTCPTLSASLFFTYALTYINKSTCTLYVPIGSIDTYKAANEWKDFTNIIDDSPTVSTTNPTKITNATASSGGIIIKPVTSSPITNRGVCWSTTANPTIANVKTNDGNGTGTFTSSIAGLTPATTYHIRAYITSNNITSYGSDLSFTTSAIIPASFSLSAPTNGGWTTTTPLFQWATSTGAFSYNLYIDDVLKKENITTTSYQLLPAEALSSGMHTWYVVAGDGYAVQSNDTWSFRVDATQPTAFSLVSPTDNSWTANLQPTLTWGASSDVNSGLAKYQLWVDGVLNRDNISATTATPTTALTNGSHTWEIRAVDNVGNVKNSTQIWTIKIDNLPPGTIDNSVFFDGANDYAVTTANLTIDNAITMEAWIKPTCGSSSDRGIMQTDPTYVSLGADNKIKYRFYVGTNNWSDFKTSNAILNCDQWYHIAISHNSSTGIVKIYINGNLDVTYTNCTGVINMTTVFSIGRAMPNGGYGWKYFYGSIDEVRVWSCEKSQVEIQSYMNRVLEGACQNNLLAYYRSNDIIESSSLFDYSLNSKTANLTNGAKIEKSTKSSEILGGLSNLKAPSCSKYIQTNFPTFTWCRAIDAGVGFDKFQLFIDGNMVKDNLSDSTWTVTTPLTYGTHTWYVKGFDLLGNNQASHSRTFYIDNARPNAFNLTSPTNNQIVNLPTPNLTWQAPIDSTGGSGLRKYQLLINGVVNRDSISITQTTVAPKNALAQGVYTWTVKAYDNVGNVRQSTQTNTFYVDWENPTDFTLITPLDNSTLTIGKPEFKWHKSNDVGSGISKYELNITGQTPITILASDTSKTITSNLPNGPYTWYVKAYDVAGGFTSSNTQTFTISATVSEVEQTELNNSIKVYPNPVGSELFIESDKNERTNFEILNSIGQLVYKGILLDKTVVQTSGFNSGIYIVKLETGKTYEFKKILKK